MQKLQEEKKKLENNNKILKGQNKILNEQMMKKSEKIKQNGVQTITKESDRLIRF